MSTFLRFQLTIVVLGGTLGACGGELTLGSAPVDGSPAALRAWSGSGQTGEVGSRLDKPLVVQVLDASSQPVAGVPIIFRFDNEPPEARINPTENATNTDGFAEAEVRLGATTGLHVVEAVVAQPAAPELRTTFDVTAVADNKDKDKDKGRGRGDDDDDDEEED
jgi:hypothetical protein